jgi:hypothetical protein
MPLPRNHAIELSSLPPELEPDILIIDPAAIECTAKRLLDLEIERLKLEIARLREAHPQFLLNRLTHVWRCMTGLMGFLLSSAGTVAGIGPADAEVLAGTARSFPRPASDGSGAAETLPRRFYAAMTTAQVGRSLL